MAAKISPASPWVETYDDKSDDWLRARITHLENLERNTNGSVARRKDLFALRVLLLDRKKAAAATAAAQAAAGPAAAVIVIPIATSEEVVVPPPSR